MEELLQEVWDAFGELVQAVSEAIDDVEVCEMSEELTSAIQDTPEMEALRVKLIAAGVSMARAKPSEF